MVKYVLQNDFILFIDFSFIGIFSMMTYVSKTILKRIILTFFFFFFYIRLSFASKFLTISNVRCIWWPFLILIITFFDKPAKLKFLLKFVLWNSVHYDIFLPTYLFEKIIKNLKGNANQVNGFSHYRKYKERAKLGNFLLIIFRWIPNMQRSL